jgi:putative transposase
MARPRRLDGISYSDQNAYFVTTCTLDRRKVFEDLEFAADCREALLAISSDLGFSTIAYVFMPDHVHWLSEARRSGAPLTRLVSLWKQRTGFQWSRRSGSRLWQKGYWERVLRPGDDQLSIARYIVENPVRAGLVGDVRDYAGSWSELHTLEEIMAACQMDLRTGWHR